ncbi:VOC family protein [Streptomyces sp. LN699]|uniref:VOC family protein n=1 Tax=Streptomyces sp. LN699 TaxID=3112981 RepID=UPI003712AD8B
MNITGSAVLLTVDDPPASSLFFTAHLGFREVLVSEEAIHLSRDDAAADLVVLQSEAEPHALRQPDSRGEAMVSFTVTGLAVEYERLRRDGARIVMPLRQEPWGEWTLRLADPNGVVIQLVEWVPPAGA